MIECKIIIQEHLENGNNYIHNFPLGEEYVDEAFEFMKQEYNSDCIFIIEYSLN
jgi:hypothetical protein